MKLSSCRELKQQILGRAARAFRDTGEERTYWSRAARRDIRASEPSTVAAIGVAPGRTKRQYKLAIRLFRGCEHHEEWLLRGFKRHRGEMDLVRGVRYEPRINVRAGGSIGHYNITAGTLGGFVEDDENYYLMSNNHVLANSNSCFQGDRILQPGPDDIKSRFKIIGHLHRWYPLSKERADGFDVAIARFSDDVTTFEPWEYSGIGTIGKQPVADRFAVTDVIKRGRTTGVTRGTVSAYELDGVQINYGTVTDPAVVSFDDQIEIIGDPPERDFSAGGDSGSFIIDQDSMRVYALLYGGGPDADGIDRTLAHFMPDALDAMDVRLVQ